VAVAVALGRLNQPLDLMLGEVLAGPQVAIAALFTNSVNANRPECRSIH